MLKFTSKTVVEEWAESEFNELLLANVLMPKVTLGGDTNKFGKFTVIDLRFCYIELSFDIIVFLKISICEFCRNSGVDMIWIAFVNANRLSKESISLINITFIYYRCKLLKIKEE